MKDNNYEFRVGDEVETVDGMSGKIVSICHCERCAERGFFEPRWETLDGKYSDYITVNQANRGFPYYRRIGKYVWNHDANEEKSTKNIFIKENEEMKEVKLTIDGKEVRLTEEQLRLLGIEPEKKRKNPFKNQIVGENYFSILSNNEVLEYRDDSDLADSGTYNAANYFNDEVFAHQVALHQLLYRKLLKFSYDNECEDTAEWNEINAHWCIYMDTSSNRWDVTYYASMKFDDVYFSSEKGAKRAIEEVVEPFMKEHPEFVW